MGGNAVNDNPGLEDVNSAYETLTGRPRATLKQGPLPFRRNLFPLPFILPLETFIIIRLTRTSLKSVACVGWFPDRMMGSPNAKFSGCGTIFKLDTRGKLTVLHTFQNGRRRISMLPVVDRRGRRPLLGRLSVMSCRVFAEPYSSSLRSQRHTRQGRRSRSQLADDHPRLSHSRNGLGVKTGNRKM